MGLLAVAVPLPTAAYRKPSTGLNAGAEPEWSQSPDRL